MSFHATLTDPATDDAPAPGCYADTAKHDPDAAQYREVQRALPRADVEATPHAMPNPAGVSKAVAEKRGYDHECPECRRWFTGPLACCGGYANFVAPIPVVVKSNDELAAIAEALDVVEAQYDERKRARREHRRAKRQGGVGRWRGSRIAGAK